MSAPTKAPVPELLELLEDPDALERIAGRLDKAAPHAGAYQHVLIQAASDVRHYARRVRNVLALLGADRP
jgi:hypothetical protein